MPNPVIEALCSRRSIKKFKSVQITQEELNTILEAGKNAPSGRNCQSAKFVVVQNKELRGRLSAMNAEILGVDIDPFYGAPTVVVILADTRCSTPVEDACLCAGNILNAAYATGIGGCWIHRARQMFDSPAGKELLDAWGLDSHYIGVAICILGYADCEIPAPIPRKDDFVLMIK